MQILLSFVPSQKNLSVLNTCKCVYLKGKHSAKLKIISMVVQWVRPHAPNAGGPGSIPGWETGSHMHAATRSSHATTKNSTCCN